jgi:hypothetical protein
VIHQLKSASSSSTNDRQTTFAPDMHLLAVVLEMQAKFVRSLCEKITLFAQAPLTRIARSGSYVLRA